VSEHPYKSRPVADSHVWLTPPEILDALGPFDMDPCAAPEPRPWATAHQHITLPTDGLNEAWSGRVWCNPPFGKHTAAWLKRMAEHRNGTALVFARTDTAMFHRSVFMEATAVMFLAGRPKFYRADGIQAKGNSGGPICLVAYGQYDANRLRTSPLAGAVLACPP
jgi:hypothetical protein